MAALSPARPGVLTINGGSSSIRFAVYELGETLERRFEGKIDRIGLSGTSLAGATVRVIHTDAELMIARSVVRVLDLASNLET